MGVLNPLLLLLGAAAAVPLLLHLLHRHQGPRVIFPALRYLRRAEKESARRIRLRQLLLMLLRIAAVLLLALAAARPFVRAGGVGHAPTALVILLDNSMSTGTVEGERRVLDELKARALEVLADGGPDDRFWLLRAGEPGGPALAGDAGATAMRVRETEPTAAAADLMASLGHARAVLASGAEGRAPEIHLLTDLQATGFGAALPGGGAAPAVVVWHPGTDAPPNRAVAAVEVGGGLAPIAGQRTTVTAQVTGSAAAGAVDVRLTVDSRLVAAASAAPGATAVLNLSARAPGTMSGHVEINADALRADDRRFFAARVLPPPVVAVGGPLPFVDDALEVLAEAGRIRRAGSASATGATDVAIQPGALGPGGGAAVVILPPAAPTELAAVNRRLGAAGIPWRYGVPAAGEARFAAAADDALLRTLESARLRVVYPLTAEGGAPGDTVLLRLTDGSPWAVQGPRRGGGRYILLASPLDGDASTLPTTAAMLPLLDRLTGAWALALPPRTDVAPGTEVPAPTGAVLERPDGAREELAGGTYRIPADPGVYRMLRGDSVVAAYAVNAPAAESQLERLSNDALEERLPGWELHVTSSAASWRRAAFRERLGRELWRPLLVALIIVLVMETAIAAAGRARQSAGAGAPVAEPGGD